MTDTKRSGSTILLLGNYRPTLVLAREFKADGYHVISGLEGCDHGAELSRFVDEIWDHPPLKQDTHVFLLALDQFLARRPEIECIFPVSEEFVRLFAESRPVLPSHVVLASVDAKTINTCLDKRLMMDMALIANVPIAPFAEVRTFRALRDEAGKIGFPLVMRPAESTARLFGEKALTLQDQDHLDRLFPHWPVGQRALIIQKKAHGIRHNFYFAALDGVITRSLHAVITRTDRMDGSGLAVDGVTVVPDADLMRYTALLVKRLGYSGIGCAQYLVDDESGDVCFLEINSRIAGNHAVPAHCGLELGPFLFDLCRGRRDRIKAPRDGRAGVRYSWVAGDIDGLKSSLRRGEISWSDALRWAGWIIATARASNLDMMLSWRDPMPGIVTLMDVIPGFGYLTRQRHVWRFLIPKQTTDDRVPEALPLDPAQQG